MTESGIIEKSRNRAISKGRKSIHTKTKRAKAISVYEERGAVTNPTVQELMDEEDERNASERKIGTFDCQLEILSDRGLCIRSDTNILRDMECFC